MYYPVGNSYPQTSFGAQGNFNPQASFGAQGNFNPQASFGPPGSFGLDGSQGNPNRIAFANTPYGYPQIPAQQQAASQHALQQILAHQQAAQQLAMQHLSTINGLNGLSNANTGAQFAGTQFAAAWPQQQANQGQVNPALQPQQQLQQQLQQQPHHHLLQQLAQYHYLVAQQLAQLATQQAAQSSGNPYATYASQFISGQPGANFVPGITMH
jgi:hypothetical protein